MRYTDDGLRIYVETEETSGIDIRVERVYGPEPKVQIATPGYSDVIEVDRSGAIQVIAGLAAFLADTDGIPDLPEPDAGQ